MSEGILVRQRQQCGNCLGYFPHLKKLCLLQARNERHLKYSAEFKQNRKLQYIEI